MPELEFKEVSLQDAASTASVTSLIEEALGGSRSAATFMKNINYERGTARVVGGFEDDALVCMNVFMGQSFTCGGTRLLSFQSGFSATRNSHRGKGLWPRLMTFAEELLRKQGASFIFGFPNPVSHPVFVKKLGYQSTDLHSFAVLRLPTWKSKYFNNQTDGRSNGAMIARPDLQETISWKESQVDSHVLTSRLDGSLIWGKVRRWSKFGLPLSYIHVGGFELDNPADLPHLLQSIMNKAHVHVAHLSINSANEYFPLLKAKSRSAEPLIVKPLEGFSTDGVRMNFFGGMKDTY